MSTQIQSDAPLAILNNGATFFQYYRLEAYFREPEELLMETATQEFQPKRLSDFVLGAELACNGKFRAACTFNHLYHHMVKLALQEAAEVFFKKPYIQTAFWLNMPKHMTDLILHSVCLEFPVIDVPNAVNPDEVNFLPELNSQTQFILDCINNKPLCNKIVSTFWLLKDEIDKVYYNPDLTEEQRDTNIAALLPVSMNEFCKEKFFPDTLLLSANAYHILTSILAVNTEVLFWGVPQLVKWTEQQSREIETPRPE